ncbi:MAG: oxidative damage protection protein [Gammaproteobacteria bacterium]|nr:oxidative damage protection protein [Gammaproteobacteria bacterium]MCP4475153.1 oxidative damage protection protein [Gammaproteobacteria bacterium]
MSIRIIFCQKLQQKKEGLEFAPFPGEIGQRIYEEICKEAWQQWLDHQTILINENRLNMLDSDARKYLRQEMEKFLFGEGSDKPAGYVAPEGKK